MLTDGRHTLGSKWVMPLFDFPQFEKSRARRDDGQALYLAQFQQGFVAGDERVCLCFNGCSENPGIVWIRDACNGSQTLVSTKTFTRSHERSLRPSDIPHVRRTA